ncbi:two pore domain potassium channel family protein [Arthrobacter sp. JZ12]|uniref:potassium channel family protein n=1 Tax=Arthrobacter sp. JZ12 TaxID=2654190 RepID=UPI002B48467F|nr:ion channel [Arthrobacter sp. JZ12]WRH24681.1 two pore domain potassium channel family protein [Arthrobacter sp. JZ12]
MLWLLSVLGVVVILLGLVEVFHTLLHPSGRGRLSRLCVVAVWRSVRRLGDGPAAIAGPLSLVAVILFWAVLQAAGWALLLYPHIPGGYSYSPGIDPSQYGNVAEALYISTVTLTTLGYGDVIAIDPVIRFLSPFEALTGFALLTAAVSWFMQIYPALGRRRALALRLSLLQEAGYANRIDVAEASAVANTIEALTADLVQIRVDLTQTSETYYFWESNKSLSLPASLSYACDLAASACRSGRPSVSTAGTMLNGSLDALAAFLKDEFHIHGSSTEDVFRSYAADHRYSYREP